MLLKRFFNAVFGAVLLSGMPLLAYAEKQPEMNPEAQQMLKTMSEYLATLKQFTIKGESTREDVLGSGQKLMFHKQYQIAVRRPNKLHLAKQSVGIDHEIFYDGEQITLFGKSEKMYATTKAPSTLDEALDYAEDTLHFLPSGRDLLYSDVYAGLMSEVVSGSYIGQDLIDGVLCNHLAFRADEVDWQIWIEDGDRPLPRKYIITSRWLTGAPQYIVRLKEWGLSAGLADTRFRFEAPKDVSKIRFHSLRSDYATKDK